MIYDKIEKLCKEKGISIHRLETECGLSNGIIAKWKTSEPAVSKLQKVAKYFKKPIDYFLK